eukprot:Clim_evm24s198 gene=Clim_evmTU24s198
MGGACAKPQQAEPVGPPPIGLNGQPRVKPISQRNRRIITLPPEWAAENEMTREELQRKRRQFWTTVGSLNGRKEIWDGLKSAVEARQHSHAQAIINALRVYLPKGNLSLVIDDRGVQYNIPDYCLSEPTNLKTSGTTPTLSGAQGAGSKQLAAKEAAAAKAEASNGGASGNASSSGGKKGSPNSNADNRASPAAAAGAAAAAAGTVAAGSATVAAANDSTAASTGKKGSAATTNGQAKGGSPAPASKTAPAAAAAVDGQLVKFRISNKISKDENRMQVEESMMVADVVQKLMEEEPDLLLNKQVRLVYGGKILDANKTLLSYDVPRNHVVQVFVNEA